MSKFLKCLGAILVYWILIFLGPALVMLFNNISYYVSGGGWGPESLMYNVLQFFSQPIACFIAYGSMKAILKEDHKILILVNCVVASCMCFLFVLTASSTNQRWAMIVSVAACIASSVMITKEIAENNKAHPVRKPEPVEKNHAEKQRLRDKIAKMKANLKEHDASYAENKKILEEAYTDTELDQMVVNGEFPADRVKDYIEQRRNLAMIIEFMPHARETLVKEIGDLTRQLAELECQD